MLAVQTYNYQPKVSFQKNEPKQDNKPNSFTTHAGLKTGATVAAVGAAYKLTFSKIVDVIAGAAQGLVSQVLQSADENLSREIQGGLGESGLKSAKNKYLWTIPVSVAVYTGCGALIDKLINDKHSKFAENSKNKNVKDIVKDDKDAELTRKGNPYCRTNIGKKYGTLLGIVALPVLKYTNNAIKGFRGVSLIGVGINMIAGAIGGLTLGSITDHFANKGAKKFADK